MESKLNDASIVGVTVKDTAATVNSEDNITYNVELTHDTVLANLTASYVVVTATDEKATVEIAKTTDSGVTWTVVVTAEDGITKVSYTINISLAEE